MAWFGNFFGDWFGSWFGDSGGNASFAATALVVTLTAPNPSILTSTVVPQQGGGAASYRPVFHRKHTPAIADVSIDAKAQTIFLFGFSPKASAIAHRQVSPVALSVGWVSPAPKTLATKTATAKPDAVNMRSALQIPSATAIKNTAIKAESIGLKITSKPAITTAEEGQDEAEVLAVLMLSGFFD